MNRRTFLFLSGTCVIYSAATRSRLAQTLGANGGTSSHGSAPRPVDWFRTYEGGPVAALIGDSRFSLLFPDAVSNPSGENLSAASLVDLLKVNTEVSGPIKRLSDRYLIADGCMAHCGFNRALVWIDVKASRSKSHPPSGVPLVFIAFLEVDGSLRRLTFVTNSVPAARNTVVPINFRRSLVRWLGEPRRARRLAGGRLNAFDVRSPAIGQVRVGPKDIGVQRSRFERRLVVERT
jgi:hypothetical protein